MKQHLFIFQAELLRNLIKMKRYPLQTVANLVASYVMFVLMAFGLKSLGNVSPNEINEILVGYVMWSFASLVMLGAVMPLMQEMSIGILEQVYLSAFKPLTIITHRTVVSIILDTGQTVLLFLFICLTLDIRLYIPVLPVLLILILTGIGLYGFGLALAGLAVIYKRIGRTVQLLQFALLFLTGALIPLESLPPLIQLIGELLPLSLGIQIMRSLMISQLSLGDALVDGSLFYLVLNSAVYLALGVGAFIWTDRIARQQGLLGQY